MIRLNLGCGRYPKPGWINCDKHGLYQRWEYTSFADQIVEVDLTVFPYKFKDSTVDLITISHSLNQIDIEYIPKIIREIYRILKPGGIVRITDDDVESPSSPICGEPHFHAKWQTGPKILSKYMQDAGFRSHVLTKTTTNSFDKSILVANHPELPDTAVFFVEGIKPNQDIRLNDNTRLLQQALNDALCYFLYGSGRGLFKIFAHRKWLNGEFLQKIIQLFEKMGISRYRWPIQSVSKIVNIDTYAKTLATAYCLWEEILTATNRNSISEQIIPLGQPYDQWISCGGQNRKYKPVHNLHLLLKNAGKNLFVRAIVHGSIATLDDVSGFSDMDLAFIVSASTLKDPEKLIHLRKLADEILMLTYTFDPFMHHGPYYLSEIDLAWYPEAMFPPMLFVYGIDLLDNSQKLEILTRPSDDVTDQQLDMFERFFESWTSNSFVLKDSYNLEWVLGSAMLLPALYLQRRTGEFHYKRDTFPLAEKDFSPEEWEPIRTATALRASLTSRPKPPRPLVWLALRLRWPGLLQSWARRHPTSIQCALDSSKMLGRDYPQRVLRLLRTMKSKLLK